LNDGYFIGRSQRELILAVGQESRKKNAAVWAIHTKGNSIVLKKQLEQKQKKEKLSTFIQRRVLQHCLLTWLGLFESWLV